MNVNVDDYTTSSLSSWSSSFSILVVELIDDCVNGRLIMMMMMMDVCVRVCDHVYVCYLHVRVCSPVADLSFAEVGIIATRNRQKVLMIRIGNRR